MEARYEECTDSSADCGCHDIPPCSYRSCRYGNCFSWPGIGRLLVDSINSRDFPITQGVVLMMATLVLVINLLVDISYAYIDPQSGTKVLRRLLGKQTWTRKKSKHFK